MSQGLVEVLQAGLLLVIVLATGVRPTSAAPARPFCAFPIVKFLSIYATAAPTASGTTIKNIENALTDAHKEIEQVGSYMIDAGSHRASLR